MKPEVARRRDVWTWLCPFQIFIFPTTTGRRWFCRYEVVLVGDVLYVQFTSVCNCRDCRPLVDPLSNPPGACGGSSTRGRSRSNMIYPLFSSSYMHIACACSLSSRGGADSVRSYGAPVARDHPTEQVSRVQVDLQEPWRVAQAPERATTRW